MKRILSTLLSISVLSVFMLFSLASSSSGSSPKVYSNGSSGSGSAGTTTTETTQEQLITPCSFVYNDIGIAIETEYIDSIPNDDLGIYALPSGQRYLVIGVAFRNNSSSDIFVSSSDFQVYADNRLCDEKLILDDNVDTFATISSGREGVIYGFYAVPTDASVVEIEYEQSWLADELIITVGEA